VTIGLGPGGRRGKKMEAVLRLLRGESLEEFSRELQVEAHRPPWARRPTGSRPQEPQGRSRI